ncbi:MAG TPA: acyltransferase [Ramlibacter sp.]|nr:acyltransferase [Ramlibacter sp.]
MLQSLQAARALAATAVAAFHLSIMMGEDRYGGRDVFSEYTARGYLGVDFFFVLSGFIILFAHQRDIGQPAALKGYLWRRFVRLFPIYWLYVAVFALLVGVAGLGTAAKLPTTWQEVVTALTLVRVSSEVLPFPVAWSLHHELLFYLLFAVLILNARVGWAAFGLLALVCLTFSTFRWGTESVLLQTYTSTYNLYFLLGMGACFLYRREGSAALWLALGVAISVAAFLALRNEVRHAQLFLACGFAFIVAGVAKLEQAGRISAPMWLVFIGDASYTLYLLHESISGLLLKVVMKLKLYPLLGAELVYLVVIVATIALSCVAYLLLEKPLLQVLRKFRLRAPVLVEKPQSA